MWSSSSFGTCWRPIWTHGSPATSSPASHSFRLQHASESKVGDKLALHSTPSLLLKTLLSHSASLWPPVTRPYLCLAAQTSKWVIRKVGHTNYENLRGLGFRELGDRRMSNTIKTLGIVCLLFFLLCRLRFGSWSCRESHTKCNNPVCNLWVFQILTGSFLRRRSCEFQSMCDSMGEFIFFPFAVIFLHLVPS